MLLGAIGAGLAALGGDEEKADAADRAVCQQAVALANATKPGRSVFEVLARVTALRASRATDGELEAARANAIAQIDAQAASGGASPQAAQQARAAGERLGERCVELKAISESDLEQ